MTAIAHNINFYERNDLEDFYIIISVLEFKIKNIIGHKLQKDRNHYRVLNLTFLKEWKDLPDFIDTF